MSKRVIVIGGGWAGLSCAVELAGQNREVTLLEQSNRLGGRASSWVDERTGELIDNGQHLFMGCYENTIRFLRKIGSIDLLKFQKHLSVDFAERNGVKHRLSSIAFPSPFHMFFGLVLLGTLTFKDKRDLLKVYRAVRDRQKEKNVPCSAEDWLVTLDQSENIRKKLWHPIIYATLNENPKKADAGALITVLQKAFFESADASRIGISSVGLSDLCGPPAESFLKSRQGTVRLNALVSKIDIRDDRVENLTMRDGAVLQADAYVCAVPYFILKNLISREELEKPFWSPIKNLKSSPIFQIALWFSGDGEPGDEESVDFMKSEFAGMLETQTHWIFNKSRIHRLKKRGYYSLTISAAAGLLDKSDEDILNACIDEIHQCFPKSKGLKLLHSKIVREKSATLSPEIGYDSRRLPQKTPIENLFLCGDWTETGLPATIESAVLSGVKAARDMRVY